MSRTNPVIAYYHTFESKLGYRWLQGIKHFGYYPEGQESLPKREAQLLMNDQLAKKLDLPKGAVVLDAGCGEGGVALYLTKKYHLRVQGIDLLDFNVEQARTGAITAGVDPNLFQEGSYMKLPYADNTFDGLYTMETLVHAPDYRVAMREFHRVLKPGGKLVLFEYTITPPSETANKEGLAAIRKVNEYASMPAFNEFEHGTFEDKLTKAGFKHVKELDITDRMRPMLAYFARKARIPYSIIKALGLRKHFANAMSAVEFQKHPDLWKYVTVTAISEK
ncbi:MAG TPA: methyltransferase domain-containing protein [Candidatus Saccharimonadales bacterium]|nr:methyltransferase domain-containing protein [Candidatus Saccharimonadales bacterium]